MIFAIDFDGTCTTHDFPNIGKDIGSVSVLKRMIRNGHRLIIWTMRANKEKPDDMSEEHFKLIKENTDYLDHAVNWFKENDIPLWGIQRNPTQDKWSKGPKAYAHIYIDDAALGCPLKWDNELSDRPFVDWTEVERQLEYRKLLEKE